jgi:hypothetical protein
MPPQETSFATDRRVTGHHQSVSMWMRDLIRQAKARRHIDNPTPGASTPPQAPKFRISFVANIKRSNEAT